MAQSLCVKINTTIDIIHSHVMGKTKKLRNTTKLRHVPFNEQLSNTVKTKERSKSKPGDESTRDSIQVR